MGSSGSSTLRATPRILSERLGIKTSERELNRQTSELRPGGVEFFSSCTGGPYQSITPQRAIPQLSWCMQRHALIVWLVLPAWAVIQAYIRKIHPTRVNGYSTQAMLMLVAIEMHHFFTEQQAWELAKSLLLVPELTVMRQLGVLKKRSRLVPLGILESIDLYTDLVFPFLALTCEPGITLQWIRSWQDLPHVGEFISRVVSVLEFWRCAGFFVVLIIVTNISYLWNLVGQHQERPPTERQLSDPEAARVNAEDFFLMARYANMAMMPSVGKLCEEMAAQRRWIFDASKDGADRAQALEDFKKGWKDGATVLRYEQFNQEAQEREEHASKSYFTLLLLMKVVIGCVAQIYFQGTFFSLSFESTGFQAKIKVLLSMALSTIMACVHCARAAGHLGGLGYVIMLFFLIFAAWTGFRMYHTFYCQSHMWNLTTGCVAEEAQRATT